MTPEEREDLLAAYALGTLSAPDAAAVEQLVRSDSAAAADLTAYHEMVDLIALSAPLRRADPSLRDRVLRAARRASLAGPGRRWWSYSWRPAAAIAAVAAALLLLTWGVNLQRTIDRQSANNAAIAAVVEASAKQIQQLASAGVNMQQSQSLSQQLQTALADQELVIAISADPQVGVSELDPTSGGMAPVRASSGARRPGPASSWRETCRTCRWIACTRSGSMTARLWSRGDLPPGRAWQCTEGRAARHRHRRARAHLGFRRPLGRRPLDWSARRAQRRGQPLD